MKYLTLMSFFLLFISQSFGQETRDKTIVVGSKTFTESYILAEIIAEVIEDVGEAKVERRFGLGGTGIVFTALETGEIDIYPEYTGTITEVIIKNPTITSVKDIREALANKNLIISESLGFNNTYAIALKRSTAEKLHIKTITDLMKHPGILVGFSHEFLKRNDGFPALEKAYGLNLTNVIGIQHGLAYTAIESGKIELTDIYSTDAKLTKFDLEILKDDHNFFPQYYAVLFARKKLAEEFPKTWHALQKLEGRIRDEKMQELNARAEIDKKTFQEVALEFRGELRKGTQSSFLKKLWEVSLEHLYLVMISLVAAIFIGVPLGIIATRYQLLGQAILLVSGLLQTIPSLALLCFLIPFFGIGTLPSLVALFLYGLLPIVRNTYSGIISLDPHYRETARALGLTHVEELRFVELPLASITLISGIKTSAVINVGTATLAALIGAGGYGKLIITGLALNDIPTILSGAIPAALMALVIHACFEVLDRIIIPKGIRL